MQLSCFCLKHAIDSIQNHLLQSFLSIFTLVVMKIHFIILASTMCHLVCFYLFICTYVWGIAVSCEDNISTLSWWFVFWLNFEWKFCSDGRWKKGIWLRWCLLVLRALLLLYESTFRDWNTNFPLFCGWFLIGGFKMTSL